MSNGVVMAALCLALAMVGPALAQQRARPWGRGARTVDHRPATEFVGPHVCRTRNSTHCCPGWTSKPNSLLCIVPVCRPDCGSPRTCVAPNMCQCATGVMAPSCGVDQPLYNYPGRNRGGCRHICMNGGSCVNSTCACAPGWSGEFCTEPICRSPCLHGGRCISPDRCVCFHGLSGTRCEIDKRTGPCYTETRGALCTNALEGVVCTKQLCCASVGRAWGHPCERCGQLDCPHGYLRNLATKECQDIDECAAIPGLCEGGRCVNAPGSFSCECPPGQRRGPTNNCEDVDECEDPDICANGKCVNTEGDYYCLCNPHFIPSPDKKFCIDGRVSECYSYLSETGECGERLTMPLSNRDCCCGVNMGRAWGAMCQPCPPWGADEWNHLCGSSIPPGWHRNSSGSEDHGEGAHGGDKPPKPFAQINECMLRTDICGLGNCIDKEVGYTCECQEGAELAEPDGNPTCIDIDECALHYCRGGRCRNTPGSFQCICPPGFDPVENGLRCSDKNECEMTQGRMCTYGECRPIDSGGYECVCNPGYERTETGQACRDVDECRDNPRVCRRGRCHNTPGGYACRCDPGFTPTAGGYCVDVDECADDGVCKGGRCVNGEGSFQCVCEAGYRPSPDRRACLDVDECREPAVCRNGRCHNAPGSFRCDCEDGFTLSATGRTCLDEVQDLCYEKFEEGRCSGPGAEPVTRSQCCCSSSKGLKLGWGVSCKACPAPGTREFSVLCPDGPSKDNGGADINECTMIPGVCAHGTCENLEPGYRCICDPGYHPDSDGICRDVDECDMHQSYCSGGVCRNTPGSFTCVCGVGTRYEPAAQLCRDVDECAELSNPCDNGRCINTHGSYECECEHGFVLDSAGTQCIDNRRGTCWRRVVDGRCEAAARGLLLRQQCCCALGLAWGSPCAPCDASDCPCPRGFAKVDGATCRDIDECALEAGLCAGGECVNTDGSYTCRCPPGHTLDSAGERCVDRRREACYAAWSGGACGAPLGGGGVSKAVCCCSALGKAWGEPCGPCPARGTDGYRALCISEVPGPGGSSIPWGVDGNKTDYWGNPDWGQNGGNNGQGGHYRPNGKPYGPNGEPYGPNGETYGPNGEPYGPNGEPYGPNGEPYGPNGEPYGPNGEIYGNGGYGQGSNLGPGSDNWIGMDFENGTDFKGPGVIPGQMEVNECAAFPGLCGHGVCKNMLGTFTCECYPGYERDSNNHTCVDVNECEIVDNVCGAGECRNTHGGFQCLCRPGHRPDDITKVCVDIDECSEEDSLCRGGRCVNTAGSFRCECGPGLELAADRRSCKDVDECSITSGICSNGACENQMGTYQCVCDDGYAQTTVKSHCDDIDECAEDPTRCQHQCVNTPGSYYCTCREGWQLRLDGRSCGDVDECARGRVCGGGSCRNTPGAYTCDCDEGLTPGGTDERPTCLDIDECAQVQDLCGAGSCHNMVGSFVCHCPPGYSVKPELGPACEDDDECELGSCDCHDAADCVNLPGSYQCRCREGWRGDGTSCEDVDECLTNNGGCHPRAACRNTDGSFTCLCETGYKGDGYQCVDIDECANDPTLCENGHCGNTPGGYECDCDVGFSRAPDGRSCLDMDECATFDNVCVFGRCVNTYGMFKCICDKGYQSDNIDDLMPGFNCTDIDECKSPQSCQYGQCVNTPGSYTCQCPVNYDLVSDGTACFDGRRARCYAGGGLTLRAGDQCRDNDELSEDGTMAACCCSVGAAWGNYCDPCPEPGSEAFRQLCPGGPGYQPVLEPPSYVVTLADIDECAAHPGLCAHGTCTNTFGSFVCTCGPGWRLTPGPRCEDEDECANEDVCGPGVCRNLPGSYVCLCPEGYVAMPSGKECVDVRQKQCYMEYDESTNRCLNPVGVHQTKYLCCCSVGHAWGDCEPCPTRGSQAHAALCGERPGEYKNPVTNQTTPIDECQLMPQLCRPGSCHDTPTGFQCGCDIGYEHDTTSHVCRDIDECAQSPPPCRGLAQCVNLPGAFECRCPTGYIASGLDDCADLDECQDPRMCEHGDCTNTIGSYRCECRAGYTLRDNTCVDVDECARPRPLCRNGTCENLPGSYRCHCDDGFKATSNNECVDINECREGGLVCRNGRCRNTPGSFWCECAAGYTLAADGRHCRDVNECEEVPHPCGTDGSPSCTNTNGGYECSCGEGWRLSGRRCVDRDECREIPFACAGGTCRNFDGGFVCECPEDWRFSKSAAVCVDERRELCYDQYSGGRCHAARPLQLSRPDCCCSEGAAWGRNCEKCPPPDSGEFLQICQGGMGRPNLTQDLDECAVRPDVCENGRCVNTDGSFRCTCGAGYTLDDSGRRCVDRDECLDPRVCGNGTCANTPGGYECRCNHGFTQGGDQTCVDIDECSAGLHRCSFRCHNTAGSYRCTCPYGYTLASDGAHCKDVDECVATPEVCPHACENTVGSFLCKCADGYRRTSSAHDSPDACEDIDECSSSDGDGACAGGVCINTDGGFECECDPGWAPSKDRKACIDRRTGQCHRSLLGGRCQPEPWPRGPVHSSPSHVTRAQCCCTVGVAWGPECSLCPEPGSHARAELCTAANLLPDHGIDGGSIIDESGSHGGHGTHGGSGGHGTHGGSSHGGGGNGGGFIPGGGIIGGGGVIGGGDGFTDIDECAAMPDLCAPGRCVNTIGSFRCVCPAGYKPTNGECVDVDECSRSPSPCSHTCINTLGSYRCECPDGRRLSDDGICRDIDECLEGTHTCHQTCTNTDGSYECSCTEGYVQRGDACDDINECLEDGICPGGTCVNLLGSFRCVCPRGGRGGTGGRCRPRGGVGGCGACDGLCRNVGGVYRCDCPSGTSRAGGSCLPVDACAAAPCGASPCFTLDDNYRCGCPAGYGWDQGHGACVQMAGGCASASCLFGCSAGAGSGWQCGCPAGYTLVGAGHCLAAGSTLPGDIGDVPVFPLSDQFRVGGDSDVISTEGCFSCKVNGRRRRAPEEGIVYANGTTLVKKQRRRSRRRRSLPETETEVIVVRASNSDLRPRKPLLRLIPAEGGAAPHYRLVYGDEDRLFVLGRRQGVWALRLRKPLPKGASLHRQVEIEARLLPPRPARPARRRRAAAPAPLRLYVTVIVTP